MAFASDIFLISEQLAALVVAPMEVALFQAAILAVVFTITPKPVVIRLAMILAKLSARAAEPVAQEAAIKRRLVILAMEELPLPHALALLEHKHSGWLVTSVVIN